MANILEQFRDWLLAPLMGDTWRENRNDILSRRAYRKGKQKQPLKSKGDSIIVNLTGLIVERSISMLFGKGVEFDLPGEDDTPEKQYIDAVYRENKKGQFLHRLAEYGAEAGTCYVKILPDGVLGKDNAKYPRLVSIDPAWVLMESAPEDWETVIKYTIAYNVTDPTTGKEIAKKQEIEHDIIERVDGVDMVTGWSIRDYQADGNGRWELLDERRWEQTFPPILHWQNLPKNGTPYGLPDVTDDIKDLQDKFNFVVSNVGKIIKYHAHPKTWGRRLGKTETQTWGVDDMIISDDPEAFLQNLEMQSDLMSSMNFIQFLRQSLFDISRSVDIDSLADKLGALTNFALRVLYQDAMQKLETKRRLYGDALSELNYRLLVLANAANTDGGECKWPEVLPINKVEQAQSLSADQDAGRVSKQTAVTEQGRDWTQEEERIAQEQTSSGNIGANIIASFNRTGQ